MCGEEVIAVDALQDAVRVVELDRRIELAHEPVGLLLPARRARDAVRAVSAVAVDEVARIGPDALVLGPHVLEARLGIAIRPPPGRAELVHLRLVLQDAMVVPVPDRAADHLLVVVDVLLAPLEVREGVAARMGVLGLENRQMRADGANEVERRLGSVVNGADIDAVRRARQEITQQSLAPEDLRMRQEAWPRRVELLYQVKDRAQRLLRIGILVADGPERHARLVLVAPDRARGAVNHVRQCLELVQVLPPARRIGYLVRHVEAHPRAFLVEGGRERIVGRADEVDVGALHRLEPAAEVVAREGAAVFGVGFVEADAAQEDGMSVDEQPDALDAHVLKPHLLDKTLHELPVRPEEEHLKAVEVRRLCRPEVGIPHDARQRVQAVLRRHVPAERLLTGAV